MRPEGFPFWFPSKGGSNNTPRTLYSGFEFVRGSSMQFSKPTAQSYTNTRDRYNNSNYRDEQG